MLGRRLKVCFLDTESLVTRCKMIDTCMPHAMSTFELTCFNPLKQYRHSLSVRIWMLESRWKILDFPSRIDFCNRCKIINACMPHAIWTFELTYFHLRKQYRHSLSVRIWMLESRKRFRLRAANRFLWRDAKLPTCACHTWCHHLSPPISTHGNSTDTHLRSECECSSLAKDFRLRVANWFLWRNAKVSIYACHTRSERLSSPISTYENSTDTHFRSEYECSSLVTDFRFCVCTLWGVEVKTTLKNNLKTIFVLYVLALVLSPDFHVVTPILSLY